MSTLKTKTCKPNDLAALGRAVSGSASMAIRATPGLPSEAQEGAARDLYIENETAEFRAIIGRAYRAHREDGAPLPRWKVLDNEKDAKLVDELLKIDRSEFTQPRVLLCDGNSDHESLMICRQHLDRNHGCTTPAEEFISSLLFRARLGGLTPEMVEGELEEFRSNFESATRYAQIITEDMFAYVRDINSWVKESLWNLQSINALTRELNDSVTWSMRDNLAMLATGGGGGGVTVNMAGAYVMSPRAIDDFVDIVANRLRARGAVK